MVIRHMNTQIDQLVQHCLQKSSLEQAELSELQALADQYPYFVPAQVILARYLSVHELDGRDEQVAKTALYLCNPLMLESFVTRGTINELTFSSKGYSSGDQMSAPEYGQEQDLQLDDEPVNDIPSPGTSASHESTPEPVALPEQSINEIQEFHAPEHATAAANEPASDFEVIEEPDESIAKDHDAELVKESVEKQETEQPDSDEAPPVVEVEEVAEPEMSTTAAQETDDRGENEQPEEKPVVVQVNTEERPKVEEATPAFEPYHTVDYFASQGIKLQQSEFGQDKLGKQLKSFTEWLRSMKKLPAASTQQDEVVSVIAEHSLEDKEVLTEAMAEVWIKQGNREKAREIYGKLSLQNPSKSSYFAAKIEQLNSF